MAMDDKTKRISIVIGTNTDGTKRWDTRYTNGGVRVTPWKKNVLFEGENSRWVVHVLAKHNGSLYGFNLSLETWYALYQHWFHGEKTQTLEIPERCKFPNIEIVCDFNVCPAENPNAVRLDIYNKSSALTLSSAQYSFKQFDTMLQVIKQMPETREDWKNLQSMYVKGKK